MFLCHRLQVQKSVTSIEYLCSFTVTANAVNILAVSNDGYLLVGEFMSQRLYIYTTNGSCVEMLDFVSGVSDAAWTLHGDIVYISNGKVVILTRNRVVLSETSVVGSVLSVLRDGSIYIADPDNNNLYQSTDGGRTWNVTFHSNATYFRLLHAIKVSSDQYAEAMWTVESNDIYASRLCIYTLRSSDAGADSETCRDVTTPFTLYQGDQFSRLSYDGFSTIFALLENPIRLDDFPQIVHTWLADGQYYRQLQLFPPNNSSWVECITIDSGNHVMYVGQSTCTVSVFTLSYA